MNLGKTSIPTGTKKCKKIVNSSFNPLDFEVVAIKLQNFTFLQFSYQFLEKPGSTSGCNLEFVLNIQVSCSC